MKRQKKPTQRKEQTRNTEVQINEEEIGKLLEKEFRIMIVKLIKNLENKMEKMQESINKDLEELKNKHTETSNTITEIKNTLEGINSIISEAEEQISEVEDKMVEITSEEQNKVRRMKRADDSLKELWDHVKYTNIRIIGVPVLLPGKSHGRRSLVGCSHGVAKSQTRLSNFTFTFHFHALEKEMTTHSSVLAWKISGTGEPGGLPSMGLHRVGHD